MKSFKAYITCDGCKAIRTVGFGEHSSQQGVMDYLEKLVQSEKWTVDGDNHYCPECSTQRKGEQK